MGAPMRIWLPPVRKPPTSGEYVIGVAILLSIVVIILILAWAL